MVQNNISHLIFAKAKVASMKSKTFPTLKLLFVYLALKCLPLLLKNYKKIYSKNIYVAVDTQVVLSWILSQSITSKNNFTKNCFTEIIHMLNQETYQFSVGLVFKYVPSAKNPAGVIIRGVSLKKI